MDNLPVVACRYLCLKWFYLGSGVHFAFTWLVAPVIVGVTRTETTVVCPFWSWLGCFMTKITIMLSHHVPGEVPYFLVTTSFEVVVPVGGSLGAQFGDLSV